MSYGIILCGSRYVNKLLFMVIINNPILTNADKKYLGSRLSVIGIVDPSIKRVEQVLSQKTSSPAALCYTKTKHFTNITEAKEGLADQSPHLVVLGSPPFSRGTTLASRDQETQVINAFGSSPAIFCEKPISTARPSESHKVADMLARSGNLVSIGYMMRYLKIVQKALQILQDNNLTPMSISARYTCSYSTIRKAEWWDKSKDCGPIVEQATHFCDLMRYLGGEVDLDTVQAVALEHYENAGKLQHLAIDESVIPAEERIPRATSAFWSVKRLPPILRLRSLTVALGNFILEP